jgi:hypothetical protein
MNLKHQRQIALNFLPLNKSKFDIVVWKLLCEPPEKKLSEDIRQFKLPDETGEYKPHWVSFSDFNGATEDKISSDNNIYLTKFYLYNLLKQKLQDSKIEFLQREKEKKFAPYHLYIITENTEWGKRVIRFEPYYLKTKKLFGFLVDYRFLKDPNIPFDRKIQQLSFSLDKKWRSNTGYHIDKYGYITNFLNQNLKKFSKLRDNLEILGKFETIDCKFLNLRKYIFDGNKEHKSQFEGLNQFGPFEKIENGEITYIYIFQQDHIDYVNYLIKALNGKSFATFGGLSKFGLPEQTKENTKGIKIKSFDEDIETHINELSQNSIIISVFPAKEEKFYYKLKSICFKKDIPLQAIHIETIIDENKLKWSLAGIALQMLAKLGGIPWIIEAENRDCLIIGIGQSIERNEANKPIRFFAYSILLDSSGKFLTIEPLAEATDKNEYFQRIGERIPQIIKQYPYYRKIVFHIPEKIKREAIEKIEYTLENLDKSIELYIIRVNDDSKFFGYDINNNSLIPYESAYIQLSPKEFLLWTEGLNFHNPTPRKRYANPIYIDFYYSNQENVDYKSFLQDILNLSGVNYRGFNAKALPVSMFYPKLISNFYKYFKKYELPAPIEKKDKMWFL